MIHARNRGETFGLSVGEFSICNKPVLTWIGSEEDCHIEILKDKAITYKNDQDLFNIIMSLDNSVLGVDKQWDCYNESYNPRVVMEKFKTVFLS